MNILQLGFRKFEDLIGRVDCLEGEDAVDHWKAQGVDVSHLLFQPEVPDTVATHNVCKQDLSVDLDDALDHQLIKESRQALDDKYQVHLDHSIGNTDRTVGAMLSYQISKRHGEKGSQYPEPSSPQMAEVGVHQVSFRLSALPRISLCDRLPE